MNEKCFGRRQGSECAILESKVCHGNYDTCPFYKPKWKADHDRQLALRHIAGKPMDVQEVISEKYFQGRMPWVKEVL